MEPAHCGAAQQRRRRRSIAAPLAVGRDHVFVANEQGLISIDESNAKSTVWPVTGQLTVLYVSGRRIYVGGDDAGGTGVVVRGRSRGALAVLDAVSGRLIR